jgi:glutamine---fructose-6-phosphate transaminase (isomerizing)
MCGIFGIIIKPGTEFSSRSICEVLKKIAILSESRGKDSSGIAFRNNVRQNIHVIKGDISITELIKSNEFKNQLKNSIEAYENGFGFAAFGHARLVTNGSQLHEVNNQPVLKDEIALIHNGIIVNVDFLWSKHDRLKREFTIDTEIIPALIRQQLSQNSDLILSVNNALSELEGTFSIAGMFQDLNQFVLASNNGSLYYLTDEANFAIIASEKYFLKQVQKSLAFKGFNCQTGITQILPNQGLSITFDTFQFCSFNLIGETQKLICQKSSMKYTLTKYLIENKLSKSEVVIDPSLYINKANKNNFADLLEFNHNAISKLKRCTKCLLPETFPFILYDQNGVCNYCTNYKPKMHAKGLDELKDLVNPYRHRDKTPDCIVPFSGGRDSTFALHIIKKELGLNPIAFTYDWGMVTDLARRNIARVCGKLGVENIIVSADIRWKRENIRKNILAWLKNPDLGMIPLFMAGDKYFFYYCNKVKKQNGIDLNIWGINPLENTEFKTGFAGLAPEFDKKRIYSISFLKQINLFWKIAQNIFKSPGYLNQSVLDSLGSFAARYIVPKRDYYHMFDYYKWNEKGINDLIINEYSWETAIDTTSTWRIGDGTASFYNYIYYTVAGFSEIDTFRSNQIREGMLSRDEALTLIYEENQPRYETLRWYLEIIGLDFEYVIRNINNIPKLYPN